MNLIKPNSQSAIANVLSSAKFGAEAITTEPVNWVLDTYTRRYFDSVDHDWLLPMLAHRICRPESPAADWPMAPRRHPGGWRVRRYGGERPRAPASARCSPTSSCIMYSISGWSSGSGGMRPVRYGWSDMPTTTWSYSSDGRMRRR